MNNKRKDQCLKTGLTDDQKEKIHEALKKIDQSKRDLFVAELDWLLRFQKKHLAKKTHQLPRSEQKKELEAYRKIFEKAQKTTVDLRKLEPTQYTFEQTAGTDAWRAFDKHYLMSEAAQGASDALNVLIERIREYEAQLGSKKQGCRESDESTKSLVRRIAEIYEAEIDKPEGVRFNCVVRTALRNEKLKSRHVKKYLQISKK